VGGMIGMERTIIPKPRLNLVSLQNGHSVFYSCLWNYKAITNYFAGKLANRYGRKIYFWMVWHYNPIFDSCSIVELGDFCNILLGISQD
jgi:hypothetical protein